MTILTMTITVFVTQLVFIFMRTINVKAVAKNNLKIALLSGTLVHWSWLVSIAIGAISMGELMSNWEWKYIPVIVMSTIGGLIGTYYGMMEKKQRR